MEHLERAGVHSGDSIAVYPAQRLPSIHQHTILEYTRAISRALSIVGFINLQFVVDNEVVYVLEANPRASRTVPFLSKATGLAAVDVGVRVMLGETLREQGFSPGLYPSPQEVYVKAPVFSFSKLGRVDPHVGPEMKSTGEVMGRGKDFPTALYKALLGANVRLEQGGCVFAAVADKDKEEAIRLLEGLSALGFRLMATGNTLLALRSAGVQVEGLHRAGEEPGSVLHAISQGVIDLAIITPTRGVERDTQGYRWRRAFADMGIPCLTSLDTAWGLFEAVKGAQTGLHKDAIAPILVSR